MHRQQLCLGLIDVCGVPWEEQIRLMRDVGFEGFFSGWGEGIDLRALRRVGDETGMVYQSVHAPYHDVDQLWYPAGKTQLVTDNLVQCVRDTAEAGVPIMVCHAYIGFDERVPTDQGLERFEPVVREAERAGVKVAFENTEGEEFLAALLQHYAASPAVGFCWDSGHEMCYNDSQDMLARYGGRLLCTHLNDNLGVKDYGGRITWLDDLHLLPFDGIADWRWNAKRLNRCGFDGPLTFELKPASKPGRHDSDMYARMAFPDYLTLAYQRACRVAALKLADARE